MAELGPRRRPGQHADRASATATRRSSPRSPSPAARIERFATEVRNLQHTEIGEVQEPFRAGPEGLQRDAPQAQPDHRRAARRPRAAAARLRPRRHGGPGAVARARHQPLVGRARRAARRDDAAALHARPLPRRWSTGSSCGRSGCARTSSAASGLHASSRLLTALVEQGGLSREEAYAIVQRDALRAADERRPLRELVEADPEVRARPRPTSLAACFDEPRYLRHVETLIGRLDRARARREVPHVR